MSAIDIVLSLVLTVLLILITGGLLFILILLCMLCIQWSVTAVILPFAIYEKYKRKKQYRKSALGIYDKLLMEKYKNHNIYNEFSKEKTIKQILIKDQK